MKVHETVLCSLNTKSSVYRVGLASDMYSKHWIHYLIWLCWRLVLCAWQETLSFSLLQGSSVSVNPSATVQTEVVDQGHNQTYIPDCICMLMNLILIVGCCVARRLALASIGRVQYVYTAIHHHFWMCSANVTDSHPFTGVGNNSFYIKVHSETTANIRNPCQSWKLGF